MKFGLFFSGYAFEQVNKKTTISCFILITSKIQSRCARGILFLGLYVCIIFDYDFILISLNGNSIMR